MSAALVIPDSPEAMQEFLTAKNKKDDRNAIFNASADPADLVKFMNAYARLTNKADKGIQEQIDEGVNRAFASFARENGIAEFRKGGPDGRKLTIKEAAREEYSARASTVKWSDRAVGTPYDGKFSSFGEFMTVINNKSIDDLSPEQRELRRQMRNALSSTDPGAGGFLIPEEFRAELMKVALETAVVRPRARVIPMGSLRTSIPYIDSTTNSGSVYGGVVAYWTEEGAALTQSQPNFGRVSLEAKKLTLYTEYPSELAQDSAVSVDGLLSETFTEGAAFFEDVAFMRGTGVGEPMGALSASNTAMISQAAESGQAAGTIVWENIVKMFSRMLPSSLSSAVWLVPPAAFPELATMALSVGTGGSPVWLNNGVEGPPMTILGRPVIITEKASALGSANDVTFIDWRQYLIGDRMALSAETSTEYKFGNDLIAYRVIERVDGRPWMQSPITPQNGGATLSAFVGLAAR